MNTVVGVGNEFKVELNIMSFETYIMFNAMMLYETALDAAMLDDPKHFEEIGRSLINSLFEKRQLWMEKGKI